TVSCFTLSIWFSIGRGAGGGGCCSGDPAGGGGGWTSAPVPFGGCAVEAPAWVAFCFSQAAGSNVLCSALFCARYAAGSNSVAGGGIGSVCLFAKYALGSNSAINAFRASARFALLADYRDEFWPSPALGRSRETWSRPRAQGRNLLL